MDYFFINTWNVREGGKTDVGRGDREEGRCMEIPKSLCLLHPPLSEQYKPIRLCPETAEKCLKFSRGSRRKGWQRNKESENQGEDGCAPSEQSENGLDTHLTTGHRRGHRK